MLFQASFILYALWSGLWLPVFLNPSLYEELFLQKQSAKNDLVYFHIHAASLISWTVRSYFQWVVKHGILKDGRYTMIKHTFLVRWVERISSRDIKKHLTTPRNAPSKTIWKWIFNHKIQKGILLSMLFSQYLGPCTSQTVRYWSEGKVTHNSKISMIKSNKEIGRGNEQIFPWRGYVEDYKHIHIRVYIIIDYQENANKSNNEASYNTSENKMY